MANKQSQLSIFGSKHPSFSVNKPSQHSSLFVLHNGHHEEMKPEQIFDPNKYNELRAVTFSATGSFITKYLSNFKRIYIIEGLPEDKQLSKTYENLNQVAKNMINIVADGTVSNNLIKFLDHLNNPIRKKMVEHNFDLRVPIGRVIHEKFYLLSNSNNDNTRVIVGSANLSYQAMSNKSSQNEGLWIVDNNQNAYNKMLHHFHSLYASTITYLSSVIRKITHKQVKNINPKHPKQEEVLNKTQQKQIKKAATTSAVKQVSHNISKGKLTKDNIAGIKHIMAVEPQLKKQVIENGTRVLASVDLVSNTASKSKRKLKFKNLKTIGNGIHSHLKKYKIHLHKTGKTHRAKNLPFPMVVDKPELRQKDTDSGLRIIRNGISAPLVHPVDKKDVKKDLLVIDTLMKSYSKYAYHANVEYESRAMEAILYGMTAMFLGDIRNQVPKGLIRDIPLFFFIGGARKTGKTSLLQFITKSLGIYPVGNDGLPLVMRYADIPITGRGSKKGIVDTIGDEMMSGYVTPIPVNEIDSNFNYKHIGTNKIVRVMGEFQEHPNKQFSALIGVTNNDSYNLGTPAKDGRSYYLNFGKHISETVNGSKLMEKLIKSMSNSLFMDFASRFSNLIISGDISKTCNHAITNNKHLDFLYWSRQIMKHIYQSVGMQLPDYFPKTLYDDNGKIGKKKWRVFYINHYQQFRKVGKDKMSVNISAFSSKNRYHNNVENYINLLPAPSIRLNQSIHTDEVVIRCSTFFKWIELDNQKFLKQEKKHSIQQQVQKKLERDKATIIAKKKEQKILNQNKPTKHGIFYRMFH